MLSLVIVMPRYFTLLTFMGVCPCSWYEAFAVCLLSGWNTYVGGRTWITALSNEREHPGPTAFCD